MTLDGEKPKREPRERERVRNVAQREERQAAAQVDARARMREQAGVGELLVAQERPEGAGVHPLMVGEAARSERQQDFVRFFHDVPARDQLAEVGRRVAGAPMDAVAQGVRGGGVWAEVGAQAREGLSPDVIRLQAGAPSPGANWVLVDEGDFNSPDARDHVRTYERREPLHADRVPKTEFAEAWAQEIEADRERKFPRDERLAGSYWHDQLPSGIGSMFTSMATHAVGGVWLNVVGAGLGGTGSQYQDALAHGADEGTALFAGILGTGAGALNVLPVSMAFDRMNKASGGAVGHILAQAVRHGLAGARDELFQSEASRRMSKGIAQALYDEHGGALGSMLDTAKVSVGAGFVSSFLLSFLGAAGAMGPGIDRANAQLAMLEADTIDRFGDLNKYIEWKDMQLRELRDVFGADAVGEKGSIQRANLELQAMGQGLELTEYLQGREAELQAYYDGLAEVEGLRSVEQAQDEAAAELGAEGAGRLEAADAFDAEVRGAGEPVSVDALAGGEGTGEAVSPEAVAWKNEVLNRPARELEEKIRDRVRKSKLSEIDHPVAELIGLLTRKGKKRDAAGKRDVQRWGIRRDPNMGSRLWNDFPLHLKNNDRDLSFGWEEVLQMIGEMTNPDGSLEGNELGLRHDSHPDDVLEALMMRKEDMLPRGTQEALMDAMRYEAARVSREDLMQAPLPVVQERLQNVDREVDPGMRIATGELEKGDVVAVDGHLYQVVESGQVKYLRDGETITLGDGDLVADMVVPVGHEAHGRMVRRFEAQEAAEGVEQGAAPRVEFNHEGIPYEAEGTFLRFGDLPEGPSQNWLAGREGPAFEKGQSVYQAYRNPKTGKYILLPTSTSETDLGEAILTHEELAAGNRPVFEVSGRVMQENGFDGEPLIEPGSGQILREVSRSDIALADDLSVNLAGEIMDVPAGYDVESATVDIPAGVSLPNVEMVEIRPGVWQVKDNDRGGELVGPAVGARIKDQTLHSYIRDELDLRKREAFRSSESAEGEIPMVGNVGEGDGFSLEGVSEADLEAERDAAARRKARERAEEAARAPMQGDSSDVGQGRLFEDTSGQQDMFAGESAEAGRQGTMRGRGDAVGEIPAELPNRGPDWMRQAPESPEGQKLVRGVQKDVKGLGLADIVAFLNRAVRLEMRFSTSQTSRKYPAMYRLDSHVAFTRSTQSDINFHEAGHGLLNLLDMKFPGTLDAIGPLLTDITRLPGSKASAENAHEGMAEWLRLRIVRPGLLQENPVTRVIERELDKHLPGTARAIRDAARAYEAFKSLPDSVQWARYNQVARDQMGMREIMQRVTRLGDGVLDGLASQNPVNRLDRKIAREVVKRRKDLHLSYNEALLRQRYMRRYTREIKEQYNMVLQIGAETQMAWSGMKEGRGVRYLNRRTGNYEQVLRRTWQEIVKEVPGAKFPQFEQAGWALESLNRFEKDGMAYPGMRDGFTADRLREIVRAAERDIPNFRRHFDEVQTYFDALLEVQRRAGLISKEEMGRIQKREVYWPLPREVVAEGSSMSGGQGADIQTGLRRAFGSEEAILDLNTAAERRTRMVFGSVYWNDFALKAIENLQKMFDSPSLPVEARALAGQTFVPMKMKMRKVAAVSEAEIQDWVYESWLEMLSEATGESVEALQAQGYTRDRLNLQDSMVDLFRATKPGDANVLGVMVDGERQFYQVQEDGLFGLFANRGKQVPKAVQFLKWLLQPMVQNWKRAITQNIVFAPNNMLGGDMWNQMMMNPEVEGWFPLGATGLGMMNKFQQKYQLDENGIPKGFDVSQEGLLLSRTAPGSVELVNQIRHNAVWRFVTEGLYVSQHKDPVVQALATVLQPSNWMYPLYKTADVFNLITGGKALNPLAESATREGAATAVKMRGGTDRAAAQAYWNVTGPFNDHAPDANLQALISLPGFLNPMIMASYRAGQLLTDPDPAISGKMWTRLMIQIPAMFGGMAAARYFMMTDEEKEKERTRTIDDRLNYQDAMGFRLRFPWGPEGAMASLSYNAVMDDLLDRKPGDARRVGLSVMRRIVDGHYMQFLGPQFLSLAESEMNWSNFRQSHIVAPWMTSLPASEQYHARTPEFYVRLGQWMDYSPAKIQYIVQQGVSRQVDEVVRVLDALEQGKPIAMERADLPVVGRLFMRDPLGWSSAPVQELADLENQLRLVDARLNARGHAWIKNVPAEDIVDDKLYALRVQLDQMELLRASLRVLPQLNGMATSMRLGHRFEQERNVQQMMVRYAQAVLANNPEAVERMDTAIDMLKEIETAPPDERMIDFMMRRF